MKKINLVKGYISQLALTIDSGWATSVFCAVKLLVDKKVLSTVTWHEVGNSKESFIAHLEQLKQYTGCKIFNNETFIHLVHDMSGESFSQLISILSEVQVTRDSLEVVNTYEEIIDYSKNYSQIPPNAFEVVCTLSNMEQAKTVVDSFSYSANTLVGLSNYFKEKGIDFTQFKYYGVEKDKNAYEMAQLKAYLLTEGGANIKEGDSLEQPVWVEEENLQQFEYALSIPPMMSNQKMYLKKDRYNRFTGLESQIGNYISSWHYLEHMIKTATKKAIALLPLGTLFSTKPVDRKIRRKLIEEDLIEGIIYLPNRILAGTGVNTCWVIVNKYKKDKLKNKIIFIDLTESKEDISKRQCDIKASSIQEAKLLYDNVEESSISFVVDKQWFKENDYHLDVLDAIKRERALEDVNETPMIPLSSVAQIRRGVQVPKSKVDALKGNEATHYMISLGNIQDGNIILDDTSKVTPEPRWESLYTLEEGDLLITSKGNVMKIALVGKEIKNAIVTANLFCIRVDSNKYTPELLKYYLESEKGQKLLEALTRGAIIKSLASSDLEQLLIPNINLREQMMLVKLIERVETDYKKDLEIAKRRYKEGKTSINEMLGL
nr:N-6 DNA methylase [uncultured Niameybacter sp.]